MREFYNEIKRYLTPCNTVIVILNIVIFALQRILDSGATPAGMTEGGALCWWLALDGRQYYRLVTYMFLHSGIAHLFNNMLVLLFIGSFVERLAGSGRYLLNYLCSGVVAGLVSAAYNRWCFESAGSEALVYSIGASGAIFGMVGSLLFIVICHRGRIEGVSLRQLLMFLFLSIYAGFTDTGVDNIAHIAGLCFGFTGMAILYRRGGYT